MTKKIYGFTGTRLGLNKNQINQLKTLLEKDLIDGIDIEVHHGDCLGADTNFHNICHSLSHLIKIVIHPPIDNKLRSFCKSNSILCPKDYLVRNKDIVNESSVLIGCPYSNKEELRSGTWSTIRYARKINKSILIMV